MIKKERNKERNNNSWMWIRKRDGRLEPWDPLKIEEAIRKAYQSLSLIPPDLGVLEKWVEKELKKKVKGIPTVEQVQNTVVKVLETVNSAVATAYREYRKKRKIARKIKEKEKIPTSLKFSDLALKVLNDRYLLKDENGTETPEKMFERVARWVALADLIYFPSVYDPMGRSRRRVIPRDFKSKPEYLNMLEWEKLIEIFSKYNDQNHIRISFSEYISLLKSDEMKEYFNERVKEYYNLMASLKFLPNSPTLMNANTVLGQLSACFVLPVEDSIDGIYRALWQSALVHKSGGGTGFSFSRLRPEGSIVGTTKGVASGPVSFMRLFDVSTDVIKQGGKRRGANMGILRVDHPDIEKFIMSKDPNNKLLTNFNISVAITDEFMKSLEFNEEYPLKQLKNGEEEITGSMSARKIWDLIISQAWKTGDPGVIFIDEINRHNPTPLLGEIEATNPCGEQPLLPYESCNLGSINLSKFVENGSINWEKLRKVIKIAVRFLDNVITVNKFPIPEIERMTKQTRKIGLGVMGFADMLIELGIPYDSKEGEEMAAKIMSFISEVSHEESERLARDRGVFPAWQGSVWEREGRLMRNATTTTIAPTGTISIIADTSSSIEPLFALAYYRNYNGKKYLIIPDSVRNFLIKNNAYDEEMMKRIAKNGSIQAEEIPENIKSVLKIALEISPERHVRMQAIFQKYTDNAVSKTINMPNNATLEDVERAYLLAYRLGCKGITIYRDMSKNVQVLEKVAEKEKLPTLKLVIPRKLEEGIVVEGTYDNACPTGKCER